MNICVTFCVFCCVVVVCGDSAVGNTLNIHIRDEGSNREGYWATHHIPFLAIKNDPQPIVDFLLSLSHGQGD